jgi:hypothetical protein
LWIFKRKKQKVVKIVCWDYESYNTVSISNTSFHIIQTLNQLRSNSPINKLSLLVSTRWPCIRPEFIHQHPGTFLLRIPFRTSILFITDLKDRYSTYKADILLSFKEEPYMCHIWAIYELYMSYIYGETRVKISKKRTGKRIATRDSEVILTFILIHIKSGYWLCFIYWPPPNLPQRERNMPEKWVNIARFTMVTAPSGIGGQQIKKSRQILWINGGNHEIIWTIFCIFE